jgi:hypothetical protein
MDVLTFNRVAGPDPHNRDYLKQQRPLTPGWPSGLPEARIKKLLKDPKH